MSRPDPLAVAYTQIFTDTDAGLLVLRDLIASTGFMAALPVGASDQMLADHNARRAVFGRIYEFLQASPAGRRALAEALSPAETPTEDDT